MLSLAAFEGLQTNTSFEELRAIDAAWTNSGTYRGQENNNGAWRCADGNTATTCHDTCNGANPFISLELNASRVVDYIGIWNRNSGSSGSINRLGTYEIWVGSSMATEAEALEAKCFDGDLTDLPQSERVGPFFNACGASGRVVSVRLPGTGRCFNLREIMLYSEFLSPPPPPLSPPPPPPPPPIDAPPSAPPEFPLGSDGQQLAAVPTGRGLNPRARRLLRRSRAACVLVPAVAAPAEPCLAAVLLASLLLAPRSC